MFSHYHPSSNPYLVKLSQHHAYCDINERPEQHQGAWKNFFHERMGSLPHALIVDIGCNTAEYLIRLSERHPDQAFLGIEMKPKALYRAVTKSQARNSKNVYFLRSSAYRLPYLFQQNEIDRLQILFPDPWPKRAQSKNRLLKAEWLTSIAPLLARDGSILFRSDSKDYFETVEKMVASNQLPLALHSLRRDIHADHPAPETLQMPDVTLFERIFIREKRPIYEMVLDVA